VSARLFNRASRPNANRRLDVASSSKPSKKLQTPATDPVLLETKNNFLASALRSKMKRSPPARHSSWPHPSGAGVRSAHSTKPFPPSGTAKSLKSAALVPIHARERCRAGAKT